MNKRFEYLLEKHGVPDKALPFSTADDPAWDGRLPSGVLDLWRAHGIGMWFGGKFQFCDPGDYRGVVDLLLHGDPEFTPEKAWLIGFGAFGELLLWHEVRQRLQVELPHLQALAPMTEPGWEPRDPNIAITSPLASGDQDDWFNLFDAKDAPLFKRCAKQHGRLEPGECYGLFPALALGGAPNPDDVKRVKAREHFAFLAQLGPVRLMDHSGSRARFVRNLGGS